MKGKRVLKYTIVLIAIALITVAIAYVAIIKPYYKNSIGIVDKPEILEDTTIELTDPIEKIEYNTDNRKDNIYKEEQKEDEIINVLLCGMDARKYDTNSRSDTIILASYNKTQHTAKLVSFMRDTWVMLPERGWSKINAATAYGGTGLLVNTLNHNFDLDIQNYVEIKFDDFKAVIDILGGIDIELTKEEIRYINNKLHSDDRDWKNDIKSEPGMVHINGTQALWHCRNRSIGNSDFSRTERQRDVLMIIADKMLSMNLGQASKLVFEMRNHINTNIPMETILEVGKDAIINKEVEIETSRIPYEDKFSYANKNGASVIEINIDETKEELHSFLGYEGTSEGNEEENIEGNIEGNKDHGNKKLDTKSSLIVTKDTDTKN